MTPILSAQVVAVDQVHVVIICPICGQFHWHGSCGEIGLANYGTRVPHCTIDDRRRFRGEYELVTSEHTIRREKLTTKDVDAWRDIQRSKRAHLEDLWRAEEEAETDRRILGAVREIYAQGRKMARWRIAIHAKVAERAVTLWMHRHGIYYGDGRYQAISRHQAGPELSKIFGGEDRR